MALTVMEVTHPGAPATSSQLGSTEASARQVLPRARRLQWGRPRRQREGPDDKLPPATHALERDTEGERQRESEREREREKEENL